MVVAQNSEKIMHEIDKLMNDYNFQIKMFQGTGVSTFQEEYKHLKEKQGIARQQFFAMEEECNQFRVISNAGTQLGMESDSFVRDKHIGNIDTLRELDSQLA